MMPGDELLTAEQMAQADRLTIASGVSGLTLMEKAGLAVADAAASLLDDQPKRADGGIARILVLCGPGNNGGDGFVAARLLRERGYGVRLALLGDKAALKGDAAEMARRWQGEVEPLTGAVAAGDLVIDAMFGAGLSRPLEGAAADAVAAVNAARVPVVAVDVPSGLDGSTGLAAGPVIQAARTVTFCRLKPGHVLLPGRRLCGEVTVADIGIPANIVEGLKIATSLNRPRQWLEAFPWPRLDGHKYKRGHAIVVSGPAEATGAARLGARGALRIGAGLVTLVGTAGATAVNATQVTAIMVRALGGNRALAELLTDRRFNAVLIGPGAGVSAATAETVLTVLASEAAAVLDADALTSFSEDVERPVRAAGMGFVLRGAEPGPTAERFFETIKGRAAPVVLTPHEGEFARLFGKLEGCKLTRARRAAEISGAVVVLKGADTVIAAPDGRAAVNDNAPAWLATAGAGDVLGGFVTGLLAQGMPAFDAACAAVWLHGECASTFGPGLIAEDLPETLPEVLLRLMTGRDS
ncbi:MAG TPA: NAD(P)H-hydrate dehydratase [Hyphomicrobiaceae bacterium]|nr:NAD(P)H-hydrate dehydratase [Hyphomicrobiaceae bacterium]